MTSPAEMTSPTEVYTSLKAIKLYAPNNILSFGVLLAYNLAFSANGAKTPAMSSPMISEVLPTTKFETCSTSITLRDIVAALQDSHENLSRNSIELDSEIRSIVNQNFWDLYEE
ncbi:MAG: hypothetical protein KDC10_05030 [Calditrichaeota bacterium]|nr:hypothetical protein [Calditrichota bacterium]